MRMHLPQMRCANKISHNNTNCSVDSKDLISWSIEMLIAVQILLSSKGAYRDFAFVVAQISFCKKNLLTNINNVVYFRCACELHCTSKAECNGAAPMFHVMKKCSICKMHFTLSLMISFHFISVPSKCSVHLILLPNQNTVSQQ